MTAQFCPEPEGIMEQEAAHIEALQSAAAYTIIVDQLQVADASSEITLVFERGE